MKVAVSGVRMPRTLRFLGGLLVAAAATGCIKGEVGDLPILPVTHPDLNCNTPQDAEANAECRLTLGVESKEYIQQRGDKDWWVVNVGALPPRAIVHVVAGYKPGPGQDAGSFNTAVNFQINVLDSASGQVSGSLATGVDKHGSNAPSLIDLTFRYTKANNDLFILVQDDTGLKADDVSPYSIMVEVIPDPDSNEPNDTVATATPIPLTPNGNGGVGGSNGGLLATPGDVDYYSIISPNPNSVLWIRIGDDPANPSQPPRKYRLQYLLCGATGCEGANPTIIAIDAAGPQFITAVTPSPIGTARLLPNPGTYTLEVRGWIDPTNQTVIPPGDLNVHYKVEVIIVPLQDPAEPNNTFADAKASAGKLIASVGGSTSITGRISFVPDPDWYRVRLGAATAGPTLLHYKVTPSNAPARFPPVPGVRDRLLTVTTEVAAGSEGACAAGDAGVCVISASPGSDSYFNAVSLCSGAATTPPTPPQCLQSTRYENFSTPPQFLNLSNFEAVLQVPPSPGNLDYYFKFEDNGNNWADDTDYTIAVDWMADPDTLEAVPDPQQVATMGAGPGATPLSRYLSYGIGATNTTLGVAPITDIKDYDGRGDDVDTWAVSVPVGVVADARLFFQWRIPAGSITSQPYDLGIHLGFCVPDGGVDCASVQTQTQSGGSQLGLIYETDPVTSWWNFNPQATPLEAAYLRSLIGTAPNTQSLTQLKDYACGCLEQRLVPASGTATMFISVFPINRQVWLPIAPYTVETGYGPVPSYPYAFTAAGGGMVNCPTVCNFTKN